MDVKCSHIDHIFNFSRRKQRIQTEFVLQIKTVLAVLAVIMSVPSEAAPPVDKMNPYDPETSSCFFQGRLSLYRKIYNMNTKICLNFYGRLELDPNMEEVELQAAQNSTENSAH
ncbi:hypothetical protein Y032_0212g2231 [Ancylostoma ceylanicum]|nr:hypothetical protein Y032_0212g2231 [Ancylostoma ceylanicum]